MHQSAIPERYCIVNPRGGALTVRLKTSNSIVAGADFRLFYENSKELKESWKLTVENGFSTTRIVKSLVSEINKKNMVWQILCCSSDPKIFEGDIEVEIMQNDEVCKIIPAATWHRTDIPPCAINNPIAINGTVTFLLKTYDT